MCGAGLNGCKRSESPHCIDGLGDSMGGGGTASIARCGARILRGHCREPVCDISRSSIRPTWAAVLKVGRGWDELCFVRRSLQVLIYARARYGVDLETADPARER